MKNRKITKSITINEEFFRKSEELRAGFGMANFGELVRYAITDLYRKENPSYNKKTGNSSSEALTEETKHNKGLAICEQLGGEVLDGNVCSYFKYDNKDRFAQKVQVEMLDDEIINNQYTPDREHVEKIQKRGGGNY